MMNRSVVVRIAASSLILGATMVGCTTVGTRAASSYSASDEAARASARADRALEKNRIADAVGYAEAAVAAEPNNAALRGLLGKVYLKAGRFASAGASFRDALQLGDESARTIVSLALCEVAQGRTAEAQSLLAQYRSLLPANDYGLAVALAGDTKAGIAALEALMRDGTADATTRQNLGLAYAMDGRWQDAKAAIARDLSAQATDQRIMKWAETMRPGSQQTQVAALLNVAPVSDPGQPVALALRGPDAGQARAKIETVEVTTPAEPTAIADFAEPAAEAQVKVASEPVPRPAVRETPVSASAPERMAMVQRIPVAEKRQVVAKVAEPAAAPKGRYAVQIGAYSNAASARKGWAQFSRKYGFARNHAVSSSKVAVNGQTFYRLALVGFSTPGAAKSLCARVKQQNGNCYVRERSASKDVQWAMRGGQELAAR